VEADKLVPIMPEQATLVARAFLEAAPLYTPRVIVCKSAAATFPTAITSECEVCKAPTTWQGSGEWFGEKAELRHMLDFTCVLCAKAKVRFWLVVSRTAGPANQYAVQTLRKVGQEPAWSVRVPPQVAKALPGDRVDFFKKGLICMSQGFGLGAVAYFRRVVEDIANDLIDLVEQAAKLEGATDRLEKIAAARSSQRADEKLKVAAPLVPPYLLVNGQNPLARLYDAYSAGIHRETEDDCKHLAMDFRASLEFAIVGLKDQLAHAKQFHDEMAKLATRKAAKPVAAQ
jgi:hypothetical protein